MSEKKIYITAGVVLFMVDCVCNYVCKQHYRIQQTVNAIVKKIS